MTGFDAELFLDLFQSLALLWEFDSWLQELGVLVQERGDALPLFVDDGGLDAVNPEVVGVFELEAEVYGFVFGEGEVVGGFEDQADVVAGRRLPDQVVPQIVNLYLFVLLSVYYVIFSVEPQFLPLPDL